MMGLLLVAAPMFSQTSTGRISGTVKDQTGGAIVGATVVVTDVARGLARTLTTDEAGAFLAPNLIPGTYTVRATFTGFQAWERTNIALGVGGDTAVDAVLLPGAQTQTVTITEEIPLMNTTSATLSATLTTQTIEDLPVSGRNYTALLDLKPGTVTQLGNENGGGGTTSVNGLRGELSQETLIEGLHGLTPGGGVSNSPFLRGDSSTLLPTDAIQEFSQQTNTKAENSFRAGGTVNIGIKSGTNAIHGTAYGYFRNAHTDAKNYFNRPTTPFINGKMEQLGGTLGGPIKQDKLFYFVAYENQRYEHGNTNTINVAFTDPALLSNYPACLPACEAIVGSVGPNAVGSSDNRTPNASNHLLLACQSLVNQGFGLSAQSLSMVSLNADCTPNGSNYPFSTVTLPEFPTGVPWLVPHGNDHGTPGASSGFGINTYFPNSQLNNKSHNAVAKVDYTVNEKNVVNVFMFIANGLLRGETNRPDPIWYTRVRVKPMMLAGTWTWLPNSSWANSFRVGYAQETRYFRGQDTLLPYTAAELGLPTGVQILKASSDDANENLGYPQQISISGFQTGIGSRNSEPRGPHRTPEISDQVNWLRGNHSIRFGGSYFGQVQDGGTWADTRGVFTFGRGASGGNAASGLVGFLVGQGPTPDTMEDGTDIRGIDVGLEAARVFYGDPESHIRRQLWSVFLQDDWRILPRVTVNLGLRYDLATIPKDQNLILGSFDPVLGIVQEGIQIPSIVTRGDHNDISPRVGFAWDIRGNGRTVLRAGASMIYSPLGLGAFAEIGNSPGFAGQQTGWIIGCSAGTTGAVVPAGARSNCVNDEFTTPGGNREVGVVNWSRSLGDTNEIGAGLEWDGPASRSIFPSAENALRNCNDQVVIRDGTDLSGVVDGRPGTGCDIVAVDRNLRTPYVQTWTFSLQHAITNNVVVDLAYVGNHGTLLVGRADINQAHPVWNISSGGGPTPLEACLAAPDGDACNGSDNEDLVLAERPFTKNGKFLYLNTIINMLNQQTSNYNAFQAQVTARNFHGLSSTLGYTWGKALEISSSSEDDGLTDGYNPSLDYGPGRNDLRHRLSISTVYQIPGVMGYGGVLQGWRLNTIMRYQTGQTWNPGADGDFGGVGRDTRWDFRGDTSDFATDHTGQAIAEFHPPDDQLGEVNPQVPGGATTYGAGDLASATGACTTGASAAKLVNIALFGCWTQGGSAITPPAPGSFGNMGARSFTGPSYFNIDFSVTKRHQITERYTAEFRVETFNILNHPAFTPPSDGLGCSSSGCNLGRVNNTPNVGATNAFLGSGGQRRFQFGAKFIF
jgi:hypothetical protein